MSQTHLIGEFEVFYIVKYRGNDIAENKKN